VALLWPLTALGLETWATHHPAPDSQQHITMCEDGLHIRTRRHEIKLHKA